MIRPHYITPPIELDTACERCRASKKVDGWRFCSACLAESQSQTLAERKRRDKEGRQVIGGPRASNSTADWDHDEQIGGMSRCVRNLEDKTT
jgi:hypothetical protein